MDWVLKRRVRVAESAVLVTVLVLVLIAGLTAVQAQVGGSQETSGLISLEVVDADLSQVVMMLMRESNQNIIVADPDAKDKKVTVMLSGVSLETALKSVVRSAGSTFTLDSDGVYVIGGQSNQPAPVAQTTPALVDTGMTAHGRPTALDTYVARRETKVETIKLYNASPVEMMWALGLYKDEELPKIQSSRVKPGVYIRKDDGSLEPVTITGQRTSPMTESMRGNSYEAERAAPVGSEAGQVMPPVYPQPGQPGQPGQPAQPRPAQPAQPTQPGQTGTTQTSQQSGLLPEGVNYVMPYEMDNSLIVRGDEEGISELKNIISMLDIAPRQISIKAEFVSISTNELKSLGINWSLDRMNTSFGTNFAPAGNIILGYATGNVIANLRAQLSNSDGKLINAPLISTINNVPAEIEFMTQVPYLNSVIQYSSQGVPSTSTFVDTFDVTSRLWVLPRINSADDSITCVVAPEISDIERMVSSGDQQLPIVASQRVQTIRRVANGETIVLGGLVRKDTKQTVDKIPLLGDLPLVGQLFRSTVSSADDKELLILLTPTIVPEKPVAGAGIGVLP